MITHVYTREINLPVSSQIAIDSRRWRRGRDARASAMCSKTCSGAAASIGLTVGSAQGIVQCSGAAGPVAFKSRAAGMVQCFGSALAVLSAIATAQGRVQCAGSVKGVILDTTAKGLVQCSGSATAPLKGTSTTCLETSTTPPAPASSGAANYML